ncbi:MAG: hypothetical protein U9O59_03030 [Actinomycetota bacterium]|nr:hypothetical protein [Actinomycetota bacterium]
MDLEEKIKMVIEKTEIIKQPEKLLSSFDSTIIHYYMLAVPMYLEFEGKSSDTETIIREGKITWQKPKVITPSYMLRVEGFSGEARKAFEMLAEEDNDLAMILYGLRMSRDFEKMEIVSNSLTSVAKKISGNIEKKKDPYSAVIRGVDEFWDVSLSKFIQEIVTKSAHYSQLPDLLKNSSVSVGNEGFPVVTRDRAGYPVIAKNEIEILFKLFEKGKIEPLDLKQELDRWGMFEQYQDRFLKYFKKRTGGK